MKFKLLGYFWLFWLILVGCDFDKAAFSQTTCQYNPDSGLPNPLGMRAYLTITEEENNTVVTFEQFPAVVEENITIASHREMTFYDTSIDKTRELLLQNDRYYSELLGYEDPEGFAPVNETLFCQK
ncbi:MAG: hypothetical protein Tsb0014_27090 [Pleurocapsa sp.]